MSYQKSLYTVPVASTSFTTEAYFDGQGITPSIRYSYQKDGVIRQGGIIFKGVLAVRTRAESCCTAWHIESAYDTLVEVENSPWVDEIRADTQEFWRDKWERHHYMIYLDSVGCFEIIAESWATVESKIVL